jgi:hypothetical protein
MRIKKLSFKKSLCFVVYSDVEFKLQLRIKREIQKHIVGCVAIDTVFQNVFNNTFQVVFLSVNRCGEFYIRNALRNK